jgi:hypothetical protein
MNLKDRNYIKKRLRLLKDTSKELKGEFKKTKNPILEDLYLEIECYTDEINVRLNRVERNGK